MIPIMTRQICPKSRDSGNDFRVPEIGLENGCFLFLFSFPHAVSSRFSKPIVDRDLITPQQKKCCFLDLTFVSGAD